MEKWISNKIADWCIKRNKVTEIQETAIRYGIELYLDSLLKIVLLLIIGALCNKFIETVIVVSCFSLLRGEAGGIHMQTSLGCFLSMCMMTLLSVAGAEMLPPITLIPSLCIFTMSLLAVYFFAPYSTENNPITDVKIRKQKRKRAIIIIVAFAAITSLVQNSHLRALILLPVIIEIITILPFWKGREVRQYNERNISG